MHSDIFWCDERLVVIGCFRHEGTETVALAAALPCDWVIARATVLLRTLERHSPKDPDPQAAISDQWAPSEARAKVLELVNDGAFFVNSEQLLAAMRLAIEHGSDRATSPLAERTRTFSRLLLSINDRLSDEGPPENATPEQLTAFGLRAMGFSTTQILWHLIARAEAMWFTVPPMLSASKKYLSIEEEFERVTGVDLSAYVAAIAALFANSEAALQCDDLLLGCWPNRSLT